MNYFVVPGVVHKSEQDQIFERVCEKFEQDPNVVKENNKSRERIFAEIRFVSMYIFRKKMNLNYYRTSAYFKKDHATAIYAVKTVENFIETDKNFRRKVEELISQLF